MKKSHILISCERGTEELISSEITKLRDVKNIERIRDHYDLIVELESNNEEQLKKTIDSGIKNMKLIRSTMTLIHV